MARLYCPRNRLISLALAAFAICLTGFDQPDYEKHCLEGRRHLQEKNQEEALKAFSQAQQIDPRRPLAYIGEAMASRATKQLDRAVRAAERAMDCQPTDEELVTALVIRGSAYHAQKQYEPAKVDFEKAIKLAPDHAAAHSELGRLYVDLKNETRALQHFDEALKANPEDDQTYVARGKLHRKSGDLAKAARDFERAVDLQKGLPAYQFLLGQVRFENREYEASLKAANEAIDLNKQFWAAYVLKGASLYKLEQYEQAEQCLAEATRMVTIDAGAWLWLGKTRLQLGKVDQAIEDIEEIFKFDTKYVAAYRALADAYETVAEDPEKTTQFRQAAQECRETAGKLEDELRKAAALGPDFRHDTAPSRLGTTAKFDPATIAAEVLEGRVPPADMITRQVEAEAEKRRQQLAPWLNDLKLCEAKSVVPEACEAIESNLSASDERFKLKEFEYAAYGFEQVQALCQAALNEFNEVAGSDDELWLNWARQRAGRNVPDDEKIIVWAAIAEASHLCHDEKGYESAMQKVVSQVKAAGMTSPLTGAVNLLSLAEVQIRCGDQVGARSSAASAAAYSNAISDAGPRSSWLARSAGLLVRLGDGDAWSKYIPQALALAAQIGNRNDTRERKWHPIYVKCVAYAEAGALEQAFDAAAELELVEPKAYRPALADRAAPAYAAIALAAARSGLRDPSHKLVFERCYAAACAHLATLFDSDRRIKTFTRKLLASADAEAGNNTRAWVAAANIPDPNARAVSLIRIMQREVSESRFARALAWAQYLPTDARISNGSLWIAMAKVRSFSDSFVSHKKWADEPRNDAERAIRFAGVAAGISTTTEEDVKRASVRVEEAVYDKGTGILDLLAAALELKQPSTAKGGTYDSTAAADSLWWLQQAVTAAEAVEDPILRARVVFQLARACHAIGDEPACRHCIATAIRCTDGVWKAALERRGKAEHVYDNSYQWPFDSRVQRSEIAEINALLDLLFDIEEFQNDIGLKEDAFETLLLSLACAVSLPADGGYAAPTTPDSFCCWLARISGRAKRRNRDVVAGAILIGRPWSQVHALRDSDVFLAGLSAAEARETEALSGIMNELHAEAIRTHTSGRLTYAARLLAQRALIAAEAGDEDTYRSAAMTVGGLVNNGRSAAHRSVLATVAEAAAIAGEDLVAREFLKQSAVKGIERDNVLSLLAVNEMEGGMETDARETLAEIEEPAAAVDAWYPIAKCKAGKSSPQLGPVYEEITDLSPAKRAAALAGVAAAVGTK